MDILERPIYHSMSLGLSLWSLLNSPLTPNGYKVQCGTVGGATEFRIERLAPCHQSADLICL